MRSKIDDLFTLYEEKRINRRQLMSALLIASATAPLAVVAEVYVVGSQH